MTPSRVSVFRAAPLLLGAAIFFSAPVSAQGPEAPADPSADPSAEVAELRQALAEANARAADLERSNELLRRVSALRNREQMWIEKAFREAPEPRRLYPDGDDAVETGPLERLAAEWSELRAEREALAKEGLLAGDPSGREALARANLALRLARDPAEASRVFDLYRQAADARPDLVEPLSGMGIALARAGEPTSATLYLDMAAKKALETRGGRHALYADALALQSEAWRTLDPASPRRAQLLRMSVHALEPAWAEESLRLSRRWRELGDFDKALAYSSPTLPLIARLAGQGNSHEVARAQREVAFALQGLGRLREAQVYMEAGLNTAISVFGESNPETLSFRNDMGVLWQLRGEPALAASQFKRVLWNRSETLGADDPLTADARNNLGAALSAMGERAEAAELFRQAADARRAAFGPRHPDTLSALANLAAALSALGQHAEAEAVQRELLESREALLGESHLLTLATRDHLARSLALMGNFAEAEELLRRNLDISRSELGPESSRAGLSLENLARLLDTQEGRREEASELLGEALAIYREALGPDHPQALAAQAWADSRKPPAE